MPIKQNKLERSIGYIEHSRKRGRSKSKIDEVETSSWIRSQNTSINKLFNGWFWKSRLSSCKESCQLGIQKNNFSRRRKSFIF